MCDHPSLLGSSLLPPAKTLKLLSLRIIISMAWTCAKCTFKNSPSPKSSCIICSSPSPLLPSPSSKALNWTCKACTFLNEYGRQYCEICYTKTPSSSLSVYAGDDDADPSVGSVFWPLQRCKRKEASNDNIVDSGELQQKVTVKEETNSTTSRTMLKILTYNVWFREDMEMAKRMKAIGELIEHHAPDFICFQEVTPNIYSIFQQSTWWGSYNYSVSSILADTRPYFCMQLSKLKVRKFSCDPFKNSVMGRELCLAEVETDEDKSLIIATSHLESPCPEPPTWDQMFSKQRVEQAKGALNSLKKHANVIFCGDMNWNDKLDGKLPLPEGWVDAWMELMPGENGWTYDTKSNNMLSGNRSLQQRLDRFVCSLQDFKLGEIEMIGMDAIPGLSYCKEKKARNEIKKLVLPVLPSDHYGLLLTISVL